MIDAAHGLRVKYGLDHQPTNAEVRRWRDEVRQLVRQGRKADQAGSEAAKKVFPDFNSVYLASEGDTIEALLRAAEEK